MTLRQQQSLLRMQQQTLFGNHFNTYTSITGVNQTRMFAKKNDKDSDAEEDASTKSTPAKKTRAKKTTVKAAKEEAKDEVPKPKIVRKRRSKLEIQADKLEKDLMKQTEMEQAAKSENNMMGDDQPSTATTKKQKKAAAKSNEPQ